MAKDIISIINLIRLIKPILLGRSNKMKNAGKEIIMICGEYTK